MKNRILAGVAVMVAAVGLAFATEATYDYLKANNAVVMTNLAIGTMSPSKTYKMDIRGNSRQVGTVVVSTSATSSVSMRFKGAVVTISTKNVTQGDMYYETSSSKIYLTTRTVYGENDAHCVSNNCYVALN